MKKILLAAALTAASGTVVSAQPAPAPTEIVINLTGKSATAALAQPAQTQAPQEIVINLKGTSATATVAQPAQAPEPGAIVINLTGTSATAALAKPDQAPPPGAIIVHLNGEFQYSFGFTNSAESGVTKIGGLQDIGFLRLYPGFDVRSNNGLQFGVASELRTTLTTAAGPGTGTATTATTFYIRRAYAYVGSVDTGYLRFGQGDGAFSLLQDGVLEHFGDGQGWNADASIADYTPGVVGGTVINLMPGNFIWGDSSKLYATNKIAYLSPTRHGFRFAASFEPNSNGLDQDGIDAGDIAVKGSSSNRRRNTFDGMVEYAGTFNGVGVKASAGEMIGSPLGNTESGTTSSDYKQLEITAAGAEVSYAGFAIGANVKYGQVNNSFTFLVPGQRKGLNYIVGATYTRGPIVFGANVFHTVDAGAIGDSHMYNATGAAVGANYTVTPYFVPFVQYLYGQEHQLGLSQGEQIGVNGNAHQNAVAIGATLHW